jgi:hypothetical protein
MACEGLLTTDILFDCTNAMVGGMEVDVLIFNHGELDKSAITFDAVDKNKITNFQLKSAKTGILLKGVKQINSASWELVKKATGPDKFKHIFKGVLLNYSATQKAALMAMAQGGKYAVMIELKWKNALNVDAFQLIGYDSGLELQTATWGTSENDGTIQIELASTENYEENRPTITVLETDYATTATAFGNKFVQV